MGSFIDLTGKQFNRLTVLYDTGRKQGNEHIWHCRCQCGNECDVVGGSLRANRTKSCGCLKKETDKQPKGNVIDEVGHKYGHLTVIKRAGSTSGGIAMWECECDCGNPNHIIVTGDNLRRGHTQSCGCERRSHGELKVEQILKENNIKFIQEYRPFKFSSGRYASFDFYVEDKYVIEYDGETHYKYNLHGWHNKERLNAQKEHDIIKDQWCRDNNIPLIRIPYTKLDTLCIDDLVLETSNFIVKE